MDEPKIVTQDSFLVAGLGALLETNSPDKSSIFELWKKLSEYDGKISAQINPGTYYGVMAQTKQQMKNNQVWYVASVMISEAKDLPQGFVTQKINGGKFAFYTHRGPLNRVADSFNYLMEWIVKSKHTFERRENYELYDNRFKMDAEDSEIDIHIAVK